MVNVVYVFPAYLPKFLNQKINFYQTLSRQEQNQADQFATKDLKEKYIISHGILRHLLSVALQKKPEEILYKFNPFGKPMLLDLNHSNIKFNMSHSKDFAAYIISKEQDVGIDIEWQDPLIRLKEFYESILTNTEIELLQNSNFNRQEKVNLFFDMWTKKEALVKTLGKGLSYSVKTIDTSNINQQYHIMNGQNLYCRKISNIVKGYSCAFAMKRPIELSKPLLKVQVLSDCLPTVFELLQ